MAGDRIGDLHRMREMRYYERDLVRTPTGREATVVEVERDRVHLIYDDDGDEVSLPSGLLRLVRRADD